MSPKEEPLTEEPLTLCPNLLNACAQNIINIPSEEVKQKILCFDKLKTLVHDTFERLDVKDKDLDLEIGKEKK